MTTTRVTFENHGTEPVRVFWVNAGGLEQLIMPRIGPAQVMAMNASPGNELRCRGSLTSILLQVINVGIGPEQWVHVDQSGASTASQADSNPTALPAAATVESDEAQEAKRAAQESDAVGLTSREIFAKYTPTHAQAGCEHPADVAEANDADRMTSDASHRLQVMHREIPVRAPGALSGRADGIG